MDPAGASNVNNYRCSLNSSGWFGNPIQLVKIKAAQYDPAADSVTLVLAGKFTLIWPSHRTPSTAERVGPPLADVEGNLIRRGLCLAARKVST